MARTGYFITVIICCLTLGLLACNSPEATIGSSSNSPSIKLNAGAVNAYPKIASWLAKKDEIIASKKPYSLVMSGWFTHSEAAQMRSYNHDAILLAGLSVNWVWDNEGWKSFLTTVSSFGRDTPFVISDDMYLKKPGGGRVPFGWESKTWGQGEIYAMDPRNPGWVDLITSFYKNALEQAQHNGIIIDMLTKVSWCPEAISNSEWVESTKAILSKIDRFNAANKLVIFNSGRNLSEIDAYSGFMDGYVIENFMGAQLKSTFDEGLKAAEDKYIIIYAVDTDDTGQKDMNKMRLGLTLSLMNDNTYFTYDFGPRDHGQAWWFSEYEIELGKPLGNFYRDGGGFYREFEKGTVVAAPYKGIAPSFKENFIDVSSGNRATSFSIDKGDGRIYLKVK